MPRSHSIDFKRPVFQHRHYAKIAKIISTTYEQEPCPKLVYALAKAFAADNSRFDETRFLSACTGYPVNKKDERNVV